MSTYLGRVPHNHKDLTGKKYNNLTVLGLAYRKNHHCYWKCLCDCGNETTVETSHLTTLHTKSCGCLHKKKKERCSTLTVDRKLNSNVDYSTVSIYKITNKVNGKVYIGQTVNKLEKRFREHCFVGSGCKKLSRAIKKYGKNNFIIEQIDLAHSKNEADDKEIYYIKKYNSIKDGYNILEGGTINNKRCCKKVICLETQEIFNSLTEAAKKYGKSGCVLSAVCSGKKPTFCGKHWAYLDENMKPILDKIKLNTKPKMIRIRCIETGEIFNSIKQACIAKNCSQSQLGQLLRGVRNIKTAAGLHWEYVDLENKKEINKGTNRKKVPVICKETGQTFKSISECSKYFNVYRSSIYTSIIYGFRCKGLHFDFFKGGM